MTNRELTKNDSALLQGMAILMMIYHHLFCWGSSGSISLFRLLPGENGQQRVAWLCRLCIAFYAFVSGYGLCSIKEKTPRSERCSWRELKSSYMLALRQILKLLKKYWIVFAVFIPLGLILGKLHLLGLKHFLLSLAGLDTSYNAEWWYIRQYMMMVLLFPFIDLVLCASFVFVNNRIIDRYTHGRTILAACGACLIVLFALFRNSRVFSMFIASLDNGRVVYLLVFIAGYLCAFLHLFSIGSKSGIYNKAVPFIAVIMLAGCIGIRYIRAYDPTYVKYDAFITAPIVFSVSVLARYLPRMSSVLRWFGKHSTYMWLCHTFYIYYYFSRFFYSFKAAALIFAVAVVAAVITAMVLEKIEQGVDFALQNICSGSAKIEV